MLRHLRIAVMEMCEHADLHQINLLETQGDHVSEREYWAQRRRQRRLDYANAKLTAEGQKPTQTVYQTNLETPVAQKKFSQYLLKNSGRYGLTFTKHIEGKYCGFRGVCVRPAFAA